MRHRPCRRAKKRGRPRKKGDKVNWAALDGTRLPLVHTDADKRVRSAQVWAKCLGSMVKWVAVEYLREDSTMAVRKPYFCTDTERDWQWVLERYGLRFPIESSAMPNNSWASPTAKAPTGPRSRTISTSPGLPSRSQRQPTTCPCQRKKEGHSLWPNSSHTITTLPSLSDFRWCAE